jgi:hypothetical protein
VTVNSDEIRLPASLTTDTLRHVSLFFSAERKRTLSLRNLTFE